jgi:hypothetical protein
MAKTEFIFIGGLFRTGTDLLRNALNSTESVRVTGETHFFGDPTVMELLGQGVRRRLPLAASPDTAHYLWRLSHLGTRRQPLGPGGIPTGDWARRIVDHIYDHLGRHDRAFWYWLANNVEREHFLRCFMDSPRTDRALFELLLTLYAQGRPIRGEKTPAHLHHVPTLLAWFPGAKFVHMLRDPRAVFVSQRKKKAANPNVSGLLRLLRRTPASYDAYLSLGVGANWLRAVALHAHYQQAYPDRYYLLRFEDLVAQPAEELQRLCRFLDIDFDERMLQRGVVNSSFVPRGQVAGFDPAVATRWRQHLHPLTNRWFGLLCGSHLARFGYSS